MYFELEQNDETFAQEVSNILVFVMFQERNYKFLSVSWNNLV